MTLSQSKKILFATTMTILAICLTTQAYAFCFTNNMVSKENLRVEQLKKNDISALKKYEQCLIDKGYFRPFDAKPDPRPDWKRDCQDKANVWVDRYLGSKLFKKSVEPNKTQCCSYKDRDCNPSGKKNGKITFAVGSKFYVRGWGAYKIDWLAADENFVTFYEMKATDHMVCHTSPAAGTKSFKDPKNASRSSQAFFNAYAPKCKIYSWPESPPWPFQKTTRGKLIKSMDGHKCLEVGGWNKKNGANVNMWKCHGGKNQRWTFHREGFIRSEMNGKCLDVAIRRKQNAKNGSNVVVHDCHGGQNQRWRHGSHGQVRSYAPGPSQWCLDVAKRSKANGANVHVWKCGNKQANQSWTTGNTASYPQVLKVRYPGKCVDNTGGKKKGMKIHSWDCNAKNVNQQWTFKLLANNYVQIKSRKSGLCLDVAAAKKNNGAKVIQWKCGGQKNQQWKIKGQKDGWFQLRARHSGKCLDLKGPYKKNGTPFQQWDCKNVKNQSFRDAS